MHLEEMEVYPSKGVTAERSKPTCIRWSDRSVKDRTLEALDARVHGADGRVTVGVAVVCHAWSGRGRSHGLRTGRGDCRQAVAERYRRGRDTGPTSRFLNQGFRIVTPGRTRVATPC